MKTAALTFTVLLSIAVSAQAQKPTTGSAPVNGLKMYYEIHGSGSGEPLMLLHDDFDQLDRVDQPILKNPNSSPSKCDLRPRSESRLAVLPNTTR